MADCHKKHWIQTDLKKIQSDGDAGTGDSLVPYKNEMMTKLSEVLKEDKKSESL
jgi:hypothetical protein